MICITEDAANSSGDEVCTYDEDAEIGPSASLLSNSGSQFSSTHGNDNSCVNNSYNKAKTTL